MCRAFQPFTMQGIYFSLKTSFQIKISPFHLSLLQSHHILREKNSFCTKDERRMTKNFLLRSEAIRSEAVRISYEVIVF